MKRFVRRFFLFISLLSLLPGLAQVKDKNWLLIDSVSYGDIDPVNRPYVDSILTLYHKASQDTDKLRLLTGLAENIEDARIWTRYNRLAYQLACQGGSQRIYLRYKASALNNMGFYADEVGNKQAAIKCYSEALSIREQIKDKPGIANSLNNLGYIFDDLQDLVKAEEYYKQALKLREELNEKEGIVNCLNNLGALYYYQKKFPQAIEYHIRSLSIARSVNYKRGIGYALNNLGNVYRQMGDLKKALQYQDSAIKFRIEINDLAGLSGTYYNYSVIYSELKNYKKAEEYALQALDIGKKAHHNEKTREAAYLLYEIYRRDKKFEKALDMHLMFIHLRDSSNNEASRKASVRQQFKYEFEKKEAVLKAEQEKKNAVAEAESKRQKLYLVLFGAITFAIAIVAIVVIRSLRITRKQKQIIERQKQTVEEKQKEILDSIHYARRIQRSLLTSEIYIEKSLKRLHK